MKRLKKYISALLVATMIFSTVPSNSIKAAQVGDYLLTNENIETVETVDTVDANTETETNVETLAEVQKESSHEHLRTPVEESEKTESFEKTESVEETESVEDVETEVTDGEVSDDANNMSEEGTSIDKDALDNEENSEEGLTDEAEDEEVEVEAVEYEEGEGPSSVELFGPDFYGFRNPDFTAPSSYNYDEGEESIQSELPSSYDSRNSNVISDIRNQNPYGTCWAHAAMASMEASMASKGYTTKNVDYSERHLVWFSNNSKGSTDPNGNAGNDYTELETYGNGDRLAFDIGGNYFLSSFPLLRWQGAANESDYKYSASFIDASKAYSSNAHLQNVYFVNISQPDRVKAAIMKYGALEIDYFHDDYYLNSSTAAYNFAGGGFGTNHAVTVIGWDDNYSKDNFKIKPSSNGAWLVKNSWGTSWGKKGYMWISYEDGGLRDGGVATVFDAEKVDNYDKNYFYDGTNYTMWSYYTKAANVFTAQSNEKLRAVGIMLADADVNYSIQIYKNPNSANPASGTPLLSKAQTGRTSYAGYYTIPLEQDVTLSSGNKFAVVFTFSKSTGVYIDSSSEITITDYYGTTVGKQINHSEAKRGQSYCDYGYGWSDMNSYNSSESEGQNIRIHAYTDVAGKGSEIVPTSIAFNDTLTDGKLIVGVEEYYNTQVVVNPTNANPSLIWTSSNEDIAKVDVRGGITGVSAGEATITATSELDDSVKATINVKVMMKLQGLSLNFVTDSIYLDDNVSSRTCDYTVYPVGYVPQSDPIWKSSNERVLTIDNNGVMTPVHVGETTVSVTVDGKTDKKKIYVITDYIYPEFKLLFSGAVEIAWDSQIGSDFYRVFLYDKSERVTKTIQEDGRGHYDVVDTSFRGKKQLSTSQVPYGQFSYYCTSFSNAILENGKTEAWEWYSYFGDNDFNVSLYEFNNRSASITYHDATGTKTEVITYNYGDGSLVSSYSEADSFVVPSGKEFSGWNTKADGSGTYIYPGDVVDTAIGDAVENNASIDLYPQFVPFTVDDVEVSLEGSVVDSGTRINLTTTTDGAEIFFTLNGSNPNPASAIELEDGNYNYTGTIKYTDAVLLENNTSSDKTVTIKAIAVKNDISSDLCSQTYIITAAGNEKGNISDEDYELLASEGYSTNNIPSGLWVYGIDDTVEYRGTAVTFPEMKVYYSKNTLKLNTDYSVKYEKNVNVGTAAVTITGKGSYTGQIKKYFNIEKRDISEATVTASNMLYNNRAQTPAITVSYELNGKSVTLKKGKDYTVEYETAKMIEPGTYNVTIRGKGNFDSETIKTVSVDMIEAISMGSVSVPKIANQKYTGDEITLESIGGSFVVKYKNNPLIMGEDGHYTVSYSNNKEIGKATIKLIGTGNTVDGRRFVGEKNINFSITGAALSKASFSGSLVPVTYNGSEWEMGDYGQNTLSLYIKATKTTPQQPLYEGTDYEVSYANNVKAGTAKVIFKGINGYSGTVTKTFKINPYDIQKDTEGRISSSLESDEVIYAKGGVKPLPSVAFENAEGNSVDLVEKTDYTLSYSNNTSVNNGTNPKKLPTVKITGKGNYKGTKSINFTVVPQTIGTASISSADVVYKYAAGNYKAAVTLYDVNGKKLVSNTDYDKNIEYRYVHETNIKVKSGKSYIDTVRSANQIAKSTDVVPAGTTMYAYVYGKGNYNGYITSKFRIGELSIAKATVSVAPQSYTGKSIRPPRSSLVVTYGSKKNSVTLGYNDFEIVSYGENKSGTGTIVIRGINNYCGYKTVSFKIKPIDIRY